MSGRTDDRGREKPIPPGLRPFKPGQSGNPGGMPKGVREVRELARQHTATAMQALVEVCANKKAPPSARVSAASTLLDRGWGKPLQPVDINDSRPLAGVPAERLIAALTALSERAEEGGGDE